MKRYSLTFLLIAFLGLGSTGCYTVVRLPNHSADEEGEEQASWHQGPRNPAIPAARAGDLDWLFYYQLPWWQDESALVYDRPDGQPYVPEEFRQRYPEAPGYSGSYSGSPAPAVTSSLGKQPADSSQQPPASSTPDNRRDFGQGAASAPAAGSTAPQPERRDSGSSSSPSGERSQPKRR
ncbi:MAG TPA: hypothetical protein PKI62_08260 [bacterium]|nr:hypothetical protein [bacterium]HPR87405.1 hypothetical protein [bacterium]